MTALRLGEDGEYILNGNYMVMHKKVIVLPGSAIEYSGPGTVVERLNSSRPVGVDLILEVSGNCFPVVALMEYSCFLVFKPVQGLIVVVYSCFAYL